MSMFQAAEKKFHELLARSSDETKGRYRVCGGLHGIFDLSCSEARDTTLQQKCECVRQMTQVPGLTVHLIRLAYLHQATRQGGIMQDAAMSFDEQILRFEEMPLPLEVV